MTGSEYQERVSALDNPNLQGFNKLQNAACVLDLESCTLLNMVQQVQFNYRGMSRKSFATELGKMLWLIALACDGLNISMDYVMAASVADREEAQRRGCATKEE